MSLIALVTSASIGFGQMIAHDLVPHRPYRTKIGMGGERSLTVRLGRVSTSHEQQLDSGIDRKNEQDDHELAR